MTHPVRVGVKHSPQATTIAVLREVWRVADDSGFDHVWGFDHFVAIAGDPTRPVYEGWILLGAMAEATKRANIGLIVTGNSYRHPGVLAKMATTVDHLSGGRLEMGIGAGWAQIEHEMLGLHYGTMGGRINRLGEACEILLRLWSEEKASFEGRYYKLTDAIHEPKPLAKPHPPLWVGGAGEMKTLRVVARYADVWNPNRPDRDEVTRLSSVLDGYCEEIGRDPATIRRSANLRWDGADVEALVTDAGDWVSRGFTELIIIVAGPNSPSQIERVAPRLAELRSLQQPN